LRDESALRSRERLTRRSAVYVARPRRGNRNVAGLPTHRFSYLHAEARDRASVDQCPHLRSSRLVSAKSFALKNAIVKRPAKYVAALGEK
jgi:hypothetical protein